MPMGENHNVDGNQASLRIMEVARRTLTESRGTMKRRIEVTVTRSGQPRAYADSETHATMEFQMKAIRRIRADSPEPEWQPMYSDEVHSKQHVERFAMSWFKVTPTKEQNAFSRRITSLRMMRPGVWEIKIVEPFTG